MSCPAGHARGARPVPRWDAVILCAGFATRLYPLTRHQAKPLLPIGPKSAISYVLDSLFAIREAGLARIVLVSNERFAADFRNALAGPFPVPIHVISNGAASEKEKRGAVGDMAVGAAAVRKGRPFLVLAGDNLFTLDLHEVLRRYEQVGGRPVIVLHRAPTVEETAKYNNLARTRDGRIRAFYEKPAKPWSRRFATCIYAFPAHVGARLDEFLAAGNDPDKAGNFVRWLAEVEPVYTCEPKGAWFDIGSLEEMRIAGEFFTNLHKT
jgi:glucose-1-phosphate thymidylyltransferase